MLLFKVSVTTTSKLAAYMQQHATMARVVSGYIWNVQGRPTWLLGNLAILNILQRHRPSSWAKHHPVCDLTCWGVIVAHRT